MDLDLEADLGIDTVKQAEVFATIRETYGIERDDALKLRDYPTLNHVVAFVNERSACGARASGRSRAPSLPPSPRPSARDGFPRRVPVPVVRPPLDSCVPTGVELAEGARVVLMSDRRGVGKALAGRLQKRGVEVLRISRHADRRGARHAGRALARRRPDRRRLLAAGARRRGRRSPTSTPPIGATACTRRVKLLAAPCAALTTPRRSSSPPRGSAAVTATTPPAPSRSWAAPSPASPRRSRASARAR